jgi:hypothetical protein
MPGRGPILAGVSSRSERDPPTAEALASVICDFCGVIVGVHEPLVVFRDGAARETSLAAELGIAQAARYFHRDCYRTL